MAIPLISSLMTQAAPHVVAGLAGAAVQKGPGAMSRVYEDAGKDLLQTGVGLVTALPKAIASAIGAGSHVLNNKIMKNSPDVSFNIDQPKMAYKAHQDNFGWTKG